MAQVARHVEQLEVPARRAFLIAEAVAKAEHHLARLDDAVSLLTGAGIARN